MTAGTPKPSNPRPSQADDNDPEAKTWTLRPTDEIRMLVKDGMVATGKKRQTLIFDLIREKLPELVREQAQARADAEKRFQEQTIAEMTAASTQSEAQIRREGGPVSKPKGTGSRNHGK